MSHTLSRSEILSTDMRPQWKCECECGTKKDVRDKQLRNGFMQKLRLHKPAENDQARRSENPGIYVMEVDDRSVLP